jgi:hypothetical protein
LTVLTAPNIIRFKSSYEVQAGISQIGGKLRVVRATAISRGIPHLVFIDDEEIVDGNRSTFAIIVSDNDRTYTITDPDDVEVFELGPEISPDVTQHDAEGSTSIFAGALPVPASSVPSVLTAAPPGSSGSCLDGDYTALIGDYSAKMASGKSSGNFSDVLAMYADKAEDWAGAGSPGCSGAGPCLDPSHADYEPALDPTSADYDPQAVLDLLNGEYDPTVAVPTAEPTVITTEWTNGTTFPVSETDGLPGFAFTEHGMPVALDTPAAWGSGVGGIYLTDNRYALYGAFISALGEVSERRYDPTTETWK